MAERREQFRVKLHDTDAAGILFFANQFLYMHDIYEGFLREIGYPMERLIESESFFVPIVHAESQYSRQLAMGEELTVTLSVERIGDSSYTLVYQVLTSKNEVAGSGKTVHVSIDRKTREKVELPPAFRSRLEEFKARQ